MHTHTFNGPFSGTTQVSQYQKGKTDLDFTEATDSEWQWNPPGCMQLCTSLQTDNHASIPPLLPPNQQRQSTLKANSRLTMHIEFTKKRLTKNAVLFLGTIHLQYLMIIRDSVCKLAYDILQRNLSTS